MNVRKHLELLGKTGKDKVTEYSGIIESICFDLYGCIQVVVNPGKGSDGKLIDSRWFDISRIQIIDNTPVMTVPNFEYGPVAEGFHGPTDKPNF